MENQNNEPGKRRACGLVQRLVIHFLYLSFIATCLTMTGCEYKERKVYEIETVSGEILKLACPEIEPGRSGLTYIVDGDCVLYTQ